MGLAVVGLRQLRGVGMSRLFELVSAEASLENNFITVTRWAMLTGVGMVVNEQLSKFCKAARLPLFAR